MGFSNIAKKSEAMGKKSVASKLKVNLYENPQAVLDLIAHICTASQDIDIDPYFTKYYDCLNKFEENIGSDNILSNEYFFRLLNGCGKHCERALQEDSDSLIKIAVAGGYSAGKSSLLNAVTGIGNVLPTGIEPVSVVNTYLNCSTETKKLVVRGKNLKNKTILLNEDVLASIQHSSKSKVYIATVLEKLMLDIPAPQYLDKITFVDTPGYNNAAHANREDGKTDKQKAIDALEKADAFCWCIDIGGGSTIPNTDLEIIKEVCNKPFAIIFTKVDKVSDSIALNTIKEVRKLCKKELPKECQPIDIIGMSHQLGKTKVISDSNTTFKKLVERFRESIESSDEINILEHLFEEEIVASEDCLEKLRQKREELISQKSEAYNDLKDKKKERASWNEDLKELLLTHYDEFSDNAYRCKDTLVAALNSWCETLNREDDWESKRGTFSNTSSLWRQHIRDLSKHEELVDTCNDYIDLTTYKAEWRQEVYDFFSKLNTADDSQKDVEDLEEETKSYNKAIKSEQKIIKLLNEYYPLLKSLLIEAQTKAGKAVKKRMQHLQKPKKEEDTDIFSAIAGDNYKRFLSCFNNEVDLTQCNTQGFSPLTYAVWHGNNEMVKFFIDHDVDLSLKDKRGYNVLETAAICHYRDICELLMEADNSLVSSSRPLVELSKENTFEQWVSKL